MAEVHIHNEEIRYLKLTTKIKICNKGKEFIKQLAKWLGLI